MTEQAEQGAAEVKPGRSFDGVDPGIRGYVDARIAEAMAKLEERVAEEMAAWTAASEASKQKGAKAKA